MKDEKDLISQNTAKILAHKIINGEFPEETLLPGENELAKQLDISRTSVRAALQLLSGKGMLITLPKRGTTVMRQDAWNWFDKDILTWYSSVKSYSPIIEHLLSFRLIFEPNIAELAAKNASNHDLSEIEKGYQLMVQARKENSRELFNQGDLQFHKALIKASHNPFLITLGDTLSSALSLVFQETLEEDIALSEPALQEHYDVLDAIRLRNPDLARQTMHKIVASGINKTSRKYNETHCNKY